MRKSKEAEEAFVNKMKEKHGVKEESGSEEEPAPKAKKTKAKAKDDPETKIVTQKQIDEQIPGPKASEIDENVKALDKVEKDFENFVEEGDKFAEETNAELEA
jgi:hypothetical protein